MARRTFTKLKGPAGGGLLVVTAIVLAACTSTPRPVPPLPLTDRTHETDYRLDDVRELLRQADDRDDQGNRAAAVAVYEGAKGRLPADHERERRYIDVLISATWGRWGSGRDAGKAADARTKALDGLDEDPRLAGDAHLALAATYLGADEIREAKTVAESALTAFEEAQAWGRWADACREITTGLRDAGDDTGALEYAKRGADVAYRLADNVRVVRAETDIGRCLVRENPAEADEAFQRAYLAAASAEGAGWRNIVIATAVGEFHGGGTFDLAAKWGERLRDSVSGDLPDLKQTGLRQRDFATVLARYALALQNARPQDARLEDLFEHALRALQALGEAGSGDNALLESVQSSLLQIRAGK